MQYYWNTKKNVHNLIKENLNLTPILHKQRQCNFFSTTRRLHEHSTPNSSKRFNYYINKVNFVKTKWKESQIKIFTKFDSLTRLLYSTGTYEQILQYTKSNVVGNSWFYFASLSQFWLVFCYIFLKCCNRCHIQLPFIK